MINKVRFISAIICSIVLAISVGTLPSSATSGGSISLYLSAPFVQGSAVTGVDVLSEDFNSISTGNCPSSVAVGTLATSASGDCIVDTVKTYGGASVSSSNPSVGGSGSNFPATPWYGSGPTKSITFTFANPVKYVGFWWSAGNNGNQVEFFNGSTLVATYSSNDLMSLIGTNPSPYPGTNTISSIGGDTYKKGHYYGNPRGFSALNSSTASSVDPTVVFAYLNLFITGSTSVNKVVFSGPGFEFDNLTIATTEKNPNSSLVFANSILGKSVQFNPNGNNVTGTMAAQSDTSPANLTANAFSRPGFTFTGWNTLADGTGTAYADGQSYNFANDLTLFAQWLGTQTVTWAPNTSLTKTASPATPSTAASTNGNGAITYSVVDDGTTGCTVNATTGVITYSAIGKCKVRATAAATSTYSSDFEDVIFEITSGAEAETGLDLGLVIGDVAFGATINYATYGLKPGTDWTLIVRSTPQTLATGTYTSGLVTGTATLPNNLEAGWHSITLTGTHPNGSILEQKTWFKIDASGKILKIQSTEPAVEVVLAKTGADVIRDSILAALLFTFGFGLLRVRQQKLQR